MGTPAKWNYRVVMTDNADPDTPDEERVEDFRIIAVYYDEATDKIITSSDPEQAILVANSVDNLRPLVHSFMQALEHPVLHTSDLPGSDDYVDPDEREVVNENFYSAGKAYPVGEQGREALFAPMDEGAIEAGTERGQDPITPRNTVDAPDFSKATATESDDRQHEVHAAGPGPDEDPADKDPAEVDRNSPPGREDEYDGSAEAVHDDKQ